MRRDADRNQEIARAMALRGLALPLQPDLLAGGDACRNPDIELLAGRQADALLRAVDRLFQRDGHGDVQVEIEADATGIELKRAAAAGALSAGSTSEHAVEDVFEPRTTAGTGAAGTEGMGLETATRPAGATARPAAGKALEARLAVGVDLAAIELLAFVLVADNLIG